MNNTSINQSLFSTVTFDGDVAKTHAALQEGFTHVAQMIDNSISSVEYKATVYAKLQEAFMWTGVALKNVQADSKQAA